MTNSNLDKSARNKEIQKITKWLKCHIQQVLKETEVENIQSLHAHFSAHKAQYINLKEEKIPSVEHYISLFLDGLRADLSSKKKSTYTEFYDRLMQSDISRDYLYEFLRRTYLKQYESLSKNKPDFQSSEIWIGQNNADYGLLITPRFKDGSWENDESEIRHFEQSYWSIGHVIKTGFVIPDRDEKINFSNINDYLVFFEHTLVRHTASEYQRQIGKLYADYVRKSDNPDNILLLIPELRYQGRDKLHKYRLDFCVIDVNSNNKIGFELSPWSSHGRLSGTRNKNQQEINKVASKNFENEMRKQKDYFKNLGIFYLIYTDTNLKDTGAIFEEMKCYLEPSHIETKIKSNLIQSFREGKI